MVYMLIPAASGAGKVIADAVMVVLIGMLVVFAMLALLILIFWAFGKIMAGSAHDGGKPEQKMEPVKKTPSVPVKAPAPPAKISSGIPPEIIVVIAAAVAAMSSDGVQYSVKGIKRADARAARGQRTPWASAGLAENTRPF